MLVAFIGSLGVERSAQAQGDPCSGPPATPEADGFITGTPGPDVLIGTPDTDLIKGKAGDDVLCGLGAPDALLGGRGNDTLYGGRGSDEIWPGTGERPDLRRGERGVRGLQGRSGPDLRRYRRWRGGGTRELGSLSDVKGVLGTSEADTMIGSDERDTFIGDDGRDLMRGLGGPDRLAGSRGRDTARGGAGRDLCAAEIERACERSVNVGRISEGALSMQSATSGVGPPRRLARRSVRRSERRIGPYRSSLPPANPGPGGRKTALPERDHLPRMRHLPQT